MTEKVVAQARLSAAAGDTVSAGTTNAYPLAASRQEFYDKIRLFGLPNMVRVEQDGSSNSMSVVLDGDASRDFPISNSIVSVETETSDGEFSSIHVINRDGSNDANRVKVICFWVRRV